MKMMMMKQLVLIAFTYNFISLEAASHEVGDSSFLEDFLKEEMYSAKLEEERKLREEAKRNSPLMRCKDHYNLKHGETVLIQSPNFPYNYHQNDQCIWFLSIPPNTKVTVSCSTFNVGEGDYLEIGDNKCVTNFSSPMRFYRSTSGNTRKLPLWFKESCLMYLEFVSDSRDTSKGIWCSVSSEKSQRKRKVTRKLI